MGITTMKKLLLLALSLFLFNSLLSAGEADVIKVDVKKDDKNSYNFSVTLSHEDAGCKHFANKWDIVTAEGIVLGTRTLYHPHVKEQPFTRYLSGIEIPDQIRTVFIRAHDSVHQYGGKTISVDLP